MLRGWYRDPTHLHPLCSHVWPQAPPRVSEGIKIRLRGGPDKGFLYPLGGQHWAWGHYSRAPQGSKGPGTSQPGRKRLLRKPGDTAITSTQRPSPGEPQAPRTETASRRQGLCPTKECVTKASWRMDLSGQIPSCPKELKHRPALEAKE